ncbi:hypothetical protein FJZ19_00655 [Candidatus Pacearchaeota archaeon]|nr:hypothetical protein [Candidatus Pacearchaeota archaeon]
MTSLDEELRQELEEAERQLRNREISSKKPLKSEEIWWQILNNFHWLLSDRFFYNNVRLYNPEFKDLSDEQIGEIPSINASKAKYHSTKYHSVTLKEFRRDIKDALREAGAGDALMQEFEDPRYKEKIRSLQVPDEVYRILYHAYVILRKKGYNGAELTR